MLLSNSCPCSIPVHCLHIIYGMVSPIKHQQESFFFLEFSPTISPSTLSESSVQPQHNQTDRKSLCLDDAIVSVSKLMGFMGLSNMSEPGLALCISSLGHCEERSPLSDENRKYKQSNNNGLIASCQRSFVEHEPLENNSAVGQIVR